MSSDNVQHDIDEYVLLCKQFEEPIQYKAIRNHTVPDCYSEHAKSLKARYAAKVASYHAQNES